MIALFLLGCLRGSDTTVVNNYYRYTIVADESEQDPTDTSIETIGTDAGLDCGNVQPTMDASEYDGSLFAEDGLRFYFCVSEEQRLKMNENWENSWFNWGGYVYEIGGEGEEATFADHLFLTDAASGAIVDFGKVEFDLTGQSTGMAWDPENSQSIPSFRIDVGEFVDGQTIGKESRRWLSFHSGMIAGVTSEPIAYRVMRAMGETVPSTAYVWVESNVWGPGVQVPYIMLERYKQDWCEDSANGLGGGCANLWESFGDFYSWGYDYLINAETCELDDCDDSGPADIRELLVDIGYEETEFAGFQERTDDVINWDRVRRQQCINALLWIGDDPFHNTNNVVWNDPGDGRGYYLPYSVDLSAGASGWYTYTPIEGWNSLATACQLNQDCAKQLAETCQRVLSDFLRVNPADISRSVCDRLEDRSMVRDGDEEECDRLEDWYADRGDGFVEDLQSFRQTWVY